MHTQAFDAGGPRYHMAVVRIVRLPERLDGDFGKRCEADERVDGDESVAGCGRVEGSGLVLDEKRYGMEVVHRVC